MTSFTLLQVAIPGLCVLAYMVKLLTEIRDLLKQILAAKQREGSIA